MEKAKLRSVVPDVCAVAGFYPEWFGYGAGVIFVIAVIVALWYSRRIGLPLWTTCDVFAPGIALGHVIGRLGCLMAGCCYGLPTNVPWAITFTDEFANANVGTPLKGAPVTYQVGSNQFLAVQTSGRHITGDAT